jgi:hypothetical protein
VPVMRSMNAAKSFRWILRHGRHNALLCPCRSHYSNFLQYKSSPVYSEDAISFVSHAFSKQNRPIRGVRSTSPSINPHVAGRATVATQRCSPRGWIHTSIVGSRLDPLCASIRYSSAHHVCGVLSRGPRDDELIVVICERNIRRITGMLLGTLMTA